MIGKFRTVDPGLIRGELKRIEVRALAGRGVSNIQIHDLTIRCLMGPKHDPEGGIWRLAPVFDAIYFAPDYSWRCGQFDAIKFTGSIDEMERWLDSRIPARPGNSHPRTS